jgi:chromosomal replication initiator protein
MMEWDYTAFWEESMNQIRLELGEQDYSIWFNSIKYLGAAEKTISITVPSNFFRDQIKSRYQNLIETRLKSLSGKDLTILIEVSAPEAGAEDQEKADSAYTGAGKAGKVTNTKAEKVTDTKPRHPQLQEDYIFDKYVIGENNNFAANAAMAIAKNPGTTSYNPFFIYGGVGLGKTHLMQAIGNYIYKNSDSKIIYTSTESFTNEFVQEIGERKMDGFRKKYRHIDVLLIDDIHFLEKKNATQEELFYIFDALYHAKKQLVFTCDRPVSELKNLTERLKSRFEWGLKVDLQPPNYETRYAILKKKAEAENLVVPEEVLSLVAKKISTNIRDLEGAFKNLTAYAEVMGKPITLELAQQLLKDVFASPKQSNMSLDTIIRVTAEEYHLTKNDLKGKKRTATIAFVRQLAMFIARKITEYSFTDIGQEFGGRDHTTVIHSCQKIEEQIRSDPSLDSTIDNLIRTIKEDNAKS